MSSTFGQAGTTFKTSIQRDNKWKFTGKIRETIKDRKHKKWGLLVYRCDYASNDTWTKFLAAINQEMQRGLDIVQGEDLKDTLEMTPKEDKNTLDGATVDQVRDIFKAWVESDEAKAENGNETNATLNYPRYTYCVHVDADTAYVNLVQLRSEVDPQYIKYTEYSTEEEINEEEDEEEDMDHVKVHLDYIGAYSYNSLYDPFTFDRYASYRDENDVSIG
ncbi:uncharacterized protein K460DRAFT_414353 [Cucurbitaria berberidis CBS 394.84]|uniref:Uncharacterized protein n=1 Tax=Cucurbitaria berberidis CBS 394.84 TaxID=1168544 RepID=A0A9P4GM89_9PLEO|nr:uncharacterized protein K460DRAFT_414353 [Cucurbitaria berberidis CBS 394.84]KAF1847646.1 hypothetical protein K460DRAFT_414353 [Cucurbitaria berberidis CBS 394.84]